MKADYLDAHERHWQDADYLFNNQRLANADHLYGMSAECGLKRLMAAFGMPVDPIDGSPSGKDRLMDRTHADKIWLRYETYRSGHALGTCFILPSNPFADWNASQRYAKQKDFDMARVTAHKNGAETVCKLIKEARKRGLI